MPTLNSATDRVESAPPTLPLSSDSPAYLQIEELLADQIEGGEFAPGDRLPTERELTEQLGVSRMTVRAAMDRLVLRDMIVRRQGKGTFVAEEKLRQDASKLQGFFEGTVGQGILPVSRLLEQGETPATRQLAGILDLSVGDPLYRVVRVRSARGVAVVLETSFFPARVFPGLLAMDLEHSSIYRLMDQEFGARPVRARQSHEVAAAQDLEADALGIPSGTPVILVERVSWDAHDRTVEYARDLYHPDRSRFVAELTL